MLTTFNYNYFHRVKNNNTYITSQLHFITHTEKNNTPKNLSNNINTKKKLYNKKGIVKKIKKNP